MTIITLFITILTILITITLLNIHIIIGILIMMNKSLFLRLAFRNIILYNIL